MTTIKLTAENALERDVLGWLQSKAEDYGDKGVAGVLADLAHGGCASGMVSHLVYTEDAARFYDTHQKIIDEMFYGSISDCGDTPSERFSKVGWDESDPFAREDANKNILAWWGFEVAADTMAERAGIEL